MNPDAQTGHHPEQHGVSSQAGLASLRGGIGAETVTEPAPAPDCRMCDWRWSGTRSSANVAKAIEIHVRATGHDPVGDPIPLPIRHARQALANAGAAWEDAPRIVFGSIDVEALARMLWERDLPASLTPEWRDMAWADMGGSEPADERAEYELTAEAIIAHLTGGAR